MSRCPASTAFFCGCAALSVSGCEHNTGATERAKSADLRTFSVKAEESSASIPADGKVHVIESGHFDIRPTTLVCSSVPERSDPKMNAIGIGAIGLGENTPKIFKALNQASYLNGSPRWGALGSGRCDVSSTNILEGSRVELNSFGAPYRLTITLRQGSSFWQGTLERTDLPFQQGNAFSKMGILESARRDASLISNEFVKKIANPEN